MRAINAKKEGDISLTIVRDGRRQTISVTPEKSKDSGFVFETDDEDDLPGAAGQVILARPVTPATPMTAPAAVTFARPGRIL